MTASGAYICLTCKPPQREIKPINDLTEGFVIRFLESNIRVKVKFDEYVRLHRIVSMVNEKTIWEAMSSGTPIDLDGIPDEIFNEIKAIEKTVQDKFDEIDDKAYKAYSDILTSFTSDSNMERKEFAQQALKYGKLSSVLFAILDGKRPEQVIWKMIKPESEKK